MPNADEDQSWLDFAAVQRITASDLLAAFPAIKRLHEHDLVLAWESSVADIVALGLMARIPVTDDDDTPDLHLDPWFPLERVVSAEEFEALLTRKEQESFKAKQPFTLSSSTWARLRTWIRHFHPMLEEDVPPAVVSLTSSLKIVAVALPSPLMAGEETEVVATVENTGFTVLTAGTPFNVRCSLKPIEAEGTSRKACSP